MCPLYNGHPKTVTEVIQQAGRAERNRLPAYISVYRNRHQLSHSYKDGKELVKSDNCLMEKLYGHFKDLVSSKDPDHLLHHLSQELCVHWMGPVRNMSWCTV